MIESLNLYVNRNILLHSMFHKNNVHFVPSQGEPQALADIRTRAEEKIGKFRDSLDENVDPASFVLSSPRPGSSAALSATNSSITGQPQGLLRQNPQISQVKVPVPEKPNPAPKRRAARPTVRKRKCLQVRA